MQPAIPFSNLFKKSSYVSPIKTDKHAIRKSKCFSLTKNTEITFSASMAKFLVLLNQQSIPINPHMALEIIKEKLLLLVAWTATIQIAT